MKDFHREQNDFKEAIKLIRKIAKEEFINYEESKHGEATDDAYYKIINACEDFLEERGL